MKQFPLVLIFALMTWTSSQATCPKVGEENILETAEGTTSLVELLASTNCVDLAKSQGLARQEYPTLVPNIPGLDFSTLATTQSFMCQLPGNNLSDMLTTATTPVRCLGNTLYGAAVDGLGGDLSFARDLLGYGSQAILWGIEEAAVGFTSQLPFGESALGALGVETAQERLTRRTQTTVSAAYHAYSKTRDFLQTESGRKNLQIAFCLQTNQAYSAAMNLHLMNQLTQWMIDSSPQAAEALRSTSCDQLLMQTCELGGMALYEFGSDAVLELGLAAIATSGVVTAGTSTAAAASASILPIAKSVLKFAHRSLAVASEILRFFSRYLPEDVLSGLIRQIDTLDPEIAIGLRRNLDSAGATPTPAVPSRVTQRVDGLFESVPRLNEGTTSRGPLSYTTEVEINQLPEGGVRRSYDTMVSLDGSNFGVINREFYTDAYGEHSMIFATADN
jgi:hypothetical protein